MYKAHHWALYHMWFQNKSELYIYIYFFQVGPSFATICQTYKHGNVISQ